MGMLSVPFQILAGRKCNFCLFNRDGISLRPLGCVQALGGASFVGGFVDYFSFANQLGFKGSASALWTLSIVLSILGLGLQRKK
jgi:hypothetical protein